MLELLVLVLLLLPYLILVHILVGVFRRVTGENIAVLGLRSLIWGNHGEGRCASIWKALIVSIVTIIVDEVMLPRDLSLVAV